MLEKLGKRRRVLGTVNSFQEALVMASNSDAIVQVPSRLAEMLKKPLQLELSGPPAALKTPPIEITLTWHSRNKNDYEHQWLRDLIFKIVRKETY